MGGYSAEINLALRVGDELLSVAETGPDWLILREPRAFANIPAELIVTGDKQVREYPIIVRSGDQPTKRISYW